MRFSSFLYTMMLESVIRSYIDSVKISLVFRYMKYKTYFCC